LDFGDPEYLGGGTCDSSQSLLRSDMDLREDRDWAAKIYGERAELVDADEDVTCFFLESYAEICRYMRAVGYGLKGKAESVEEQVGRGLALGRYCSLRTMVQGRLSTQDIALFIYYDLDACLVGSGLVVVSFARGADVASQFADAWFEKTDAFVRGILLNSD
jgi:hypothetical protein